MSAVFEERILQIVFLLIGGAGVALGMSDPRVHGNELALGAIFVLVGMYSLLRRRR